MKDFLSFRLAVQQGKVNPRKFPTIRAEMARIEALFPLIVHEPTCTTCGLQLTGNPLDVCEACAQRLREVWPGDPEFRGRVRAS